MLETHNPHNKMKIENYFSNMKETIKKYIDQLKRRSTTLKGSLHETDSSIEKLHDRIRETEQQISLKADAVVAEVASQVMAMKEKLLAELHSSVATSKKTLQLQKSDVELQLGHTESLSVWANTIMASEPNSDVSMSKEMLNELKRCSEAEYVAPELSTPIANPVFTPSHLKVPRLSEQNLIGSLQTTDIR
jgi:predicted RNase H-like nuclease (RuvC/YqgF family)